MSDNSSGGSYYQKWYAANRGALSERRKKRYHTDPEVREKAVSRQRKLRQKSTRPSTKGQAKFREVNGTKVEVFRISDTAEKVGCSVEFIRKYEAEGIIPDPSVKSAQRYYTSAQIKLIKEFFQVMSELKYNKDAALRVAALEHHKTLMTSNW